MNWNAETLRSRLNEAQRVLRERLGSAPEVVLVLGSGMSGLFDGLQESRSLAYSEIPHFLSPGVEGHAGRLTVVTTRRVHFAALEGRSHLYEGKSVVQNVFPVRTLASWGGRTFILTNAAGGIHSAFRPGDLMLISDHLNLTGENPLIGPNLDELGPRFPDMGFAYDPGLRLLALRCGRELGIPIQVGVYAGLKGPSFETPAEIEWLKRSGADAVGMSTVLEVIALRHMRRRVLAISCITNMAAGTLPQPLTHEEVLETGRRVGPIFQRFLLRLLELCSEIARNRQ